MKRMQWILLHCGIFAIVGCGALSIKQARAASVVFNIDSALSSLTLSGSATFPFVGNYPFTAQTPDR